MFIKVLFLYMRKKKKEVVSGIKASKIKGNSYYIVKFIFRIDYLI